MDIFPTGWHYISDLIALGEYFWGVQFPKVRATNLYLPSTEEWVTGISRANGIVSCCHFSRSLSLSRQNIAMLSWDAKRCDANRANANNFITNVMSFAECFLFHFVKKKTPCDRKQRVEKKCRTHKSIYMLIGFSFDCRVLIKYSHLFEHWI